MSAGRTAFYDVAIEGAGPAGCAAAIELLRRRKRVLLYDRLMPGSGKVCGGFLGPELAAYVRAQHLGSDWGRLGLDAIRSVIVSGPGTDVLEAALPGGGGYACDRDRFDRWMLDRALEAGADLLPETVLASRKKARGLWCLQLEGLNRKIEACARALVSASGRRQPRIHRESDYFAVKTAYEGVKGLDGRVALHFVRRGHVGLNPIGAGRATMCLYVEGACLRRWGGELDGLMEDLCAQNARLAANLDGAVRTEGWRTCRAVADGVLRFSENDIYYAGDAVTMVNPIIGGGIPVALEGAALLGRLLARAADQRNEPKIAKEYAREWKHRFLRRVLVASALGKAERSEVITGALFGLLRWQPGFLGRIVKLSRASS